MCPLEEFYRKCYLSRECNIFVIILQDSGPDLSLQEIQAMTQIVYFRPQNIPDKQKSIESYTI